MPYFVQIPNSQLLVEEVRSRLEKDAIEPVPLKDRHRLEVLHSTKERWWHKTSSGFPGVECLHGLLDGPNDFSSSYFARAAPGGMDGRHQPVSPSYNHLLIAPRFTLGDDPYQFKALPFGISSAPRVFTKTMVMVVAYLCTLGATISPYLDDWFIVANSRQGLLISLRTMFNPISGHCSKLEKNHTCSRLKVLSMGQSWTQLWQRPQNRAHVMWKLIQKIIASKKTKAITIQKLLGHRSATVAGIPYAKLRMRPLQMVFLKQFDLHIHSPMKPICLTSSVRMSLMWWNSAKNVFKGAPFQTPLPGIAVRLGCPHNGCADQRDLDSGGTGSAHTLPGIKGYPILHAFVPPIAERAPSCHLIGQYHGSSLHQLPGRDSVKVLVEDRHHGLGSLHTKQCPPHGNSCSRKVKLCCGFVKQKVHTEP